MTRRLNLLLGLSLWLTACSSTNFSQDPSTNDTSTPDGTSSDGNVQIDGNTPDAVILGDSVADSTPDSTPDARIDAIVDSSQDTLADALTDTTPDTQVNCGALEPGKVYVNIASTVATETGSTVCPYKSIRSGLKAASAMTGQTVSVMVSAGEYMEPAKNTEEPLVISRGVSLRPNGGKVKISGQGGTCTSGPGISCDSRISKTVLLMTGASILDGIDVVAMSGAAIVAASAVDAGGVVVKNSTIKGNSTSLLVSTHGTVNIGPNVFVKDAYAGIRATAFVSGGGGPIGATLPGSINIHRPVTISGHLQEGLLVERGTKLTVHAGSGGDLTISGNRTGLRFSTESSVSVNTSSPHDLQGVVATNNTVGMVLSPGHAVSALKNTFLSNKIGIVAQGATSLTGGTVLKGTLILNGGDSTGANILARNGFAGVESNTHAGICFVRLTSESSFGQNHFKFCDVNGGGFSKDVVPGSSSGSTLDISACEALVTQSASYKDMYYTFEGTTSSITGALSCLMPL